MDHREQIIPNEGDFISPLFGQQIIIVVVDGQRTNTSVHWQGAQWSILLDKTTLVVTNNQYVKTYKEPVLNTFVIHHMFEIYTGS